MWVLVHATQYVDDDGFCHFRNIYRCEQSGTTRVEDIPDGWCEGNCTPTSKKQQQQKTEEDAAEQEDKNELLLAEAKKQQQKTEEDAAEQEDKNELLLTEAKLSSMMNTILTDEDYDKEKQEKSHRIQVWLEQQQVLN